MIIRKSVFYIILTVMVCCFSSTVFSEEIFLSEVVDSNSFVVDTYNQTLTFDWSGDEGGIDIPDGPNGEWVGIRFIYDEELANPVLPEDAYVWKVEAYYDIEHSYVGDLEIKLYTTNQDSTTVTKSWMIRDNEGGSGTNIEETRTDTTYFLGSDPNSDWHFAVRDIANLDTGTIENVELTIYYKYGDDRPELHSYQVPGWDNTIVVSTEKYSNTSATEIYDDQTIYVDYSCINTGNVDSWGFSYGLYLNGILKASVSESSLGIDDYSRVLDEEFGPLEAGDYTFKVVSDIDNEVTELDEDNNVTEVEFTVLARACRDIRGYKFNDINANGLWDEDEPGLKGWTIFVDLNNNYVLDSDEPNDVTGVDGSYCITGVLPGTYRVAEVNMPNWDQTYPSALYPAIETEAAELSEPVVEGPTTFAEDLSESELAGIEALRMDSPPIKAMVKYRKQIGRGKRFKTYKEALETAELEEEIKVESVRAATAVDDESDSVDGDVVLDGVPTSRWTYGCSATSAGMLFGYYDRHGYPNMYTGPANGGVAPLVNLGQGYNPSSPIYGSCSIIATQNGFDGRVTDGHVDDYWIAANEEGPDPWEAGGVEHSWGDCTADFLGTNQWKWDFIGSDGTIDFNIDGSTALFPSDSKLYDYVPRPSAGLPRTAFCHGLRLFAESREYVVTENYTQKIEGVASSGGYTFEEYKSEIDNGCPVIINVTSHTMIGVGYNDTTDEIILHDAWDNQQHRMDWGGSYEGLAMQSVAVIHLEPSAELSYVHEVSVEDCNAVDINFGNHSTPGSISGYKFNDIDGNGIWDANEPGLEGWQIYIDVNDNYQFDAGEPNAITDANGAYTIEDVYPGSHTVAEVNQRGWEQTYPSWEAEAVGQAATEAVEVTKTNSSEPIYLQGVDDPLLDVEAMTTYVSGPLINIDDFRGDSRFADIDGSGYSVVVIDSGIDLDHPYFGDDYNGDGVAERIVYSYDFADDDNDASDNNGHGSNVASIVGSENSTNTGMAPGVNIIALKVITDTGSGNFGYVEQALDWVIENAQNYNIVSVNMSLGDIQNHEETQELYGIHDELQALAEAGVIVVCSSGNYFYDFASQQGAVYPAADKYSLSVGAVYDSNVGSQLNDGAYTTDADRICPFSQRSSDPNLMTIFAPGSMITGASSSGGTIIKQGTSQAAPHIAGIAALAQQLAEEILGRKLSIGEFVDVITDTAVIINDGDDENDNVINTGLDFPRVDVMAMGEAIYNLGYQVNSVHLVNVNKDEDVTGVNFGNHGLDCGEWGYYPADIDEDCYVNYGDLEMMAASWLGSGDADIDTDGDIDFEDFAVLADQWLLCTDPQGSGCDNLLE